jgi:predicted metal-binding protein
MSQPKTTLFVCSLCRFSQSEASRDGISGGQYLIHQLEKDLATHNLSDAVQLTPLRCMAGCDQPCNVSLAAPGKLTFILSQVSPTSGAAAITEFCQQYTSCPEGKVPYQQRSIEIRKATAFVLPPLPAQA